MPLEQADEPEPKDTSFYRSADDKEATLPEWIVVAQGKACKVRQKAWRKEQISQGVLARMMACLGRVAYHQVHPHHHHPHRHHHHQPRHPLLNSRTRLRCGLQDPVCVLDPFAGTGSTGVAALRSGSFFIGNDSDDMIKVRPA